jgi:hypothetical protein
MFGSPTSPSYIGESIPNEPEHSLKIDQLYGRIDLPANLGFPMKNSLLQLVHHKFHLDSVSGNWLFGLRQLGPHSDTVHRDLSDPATIWRSTRNSECAVASLVSGLSLNQDGFVLKRP